MEIDYLVLPIDLQQIITTEQAWQYHVVPKLATKLKAEFYVNEEKFSEDTKNALEMLLNREVVLQKHDPAIIQKTLSKYYRKDAGTRTAPRKAQVNTQKADDFLHTLIAEAKELRR